MRSLVALLERLVALLKTSLGEDHKTATHVDERSAEDAAAEQARKLEEERQKYELAHYAATVTAWYSTRMEHDKSLLTLSTAGIGLLITLVTKFPVTSGAALTLFVCAIVSFIFCLIAVLWIYRRNSTHLEQMIQKNAKNDRLLGILDGASLFTFLSGIILASAFGCLMAVDSLKETNVAGSDKKGPTAFKDSLNNAISTRPIDPLSRSLNQAANTKLPMSSSPQPSAPAQPDMPKVSTPSAENPVKKP